MSWAPEDPAARSVGGRLRPPLAAILAGVAAIVGGLPLAVPALLGVPFLMFVLARIVQLPWTGGGDPAEVLEAAVLLEGTLVVVGLPILVVIAVIRLLANRDRLLLVCFLPVTLGVLGVVVGTQGWNDGLLALLGPLVASLLALSSEVDEWAAVPAPA